MGACRKEENMSRYSVVILDDEELILQSLQTLIDWEKLGCHIVGTSKTGDKGKRLIERLHPNIVITDIKMPGLTGLQLAEYCAQNEPQTKVVIVSAYADFNFAQSAMRAGTVNYLLKPISRTELQDTIEKVVAELDKLESTATPSRQKLRWRTPAHWLHRAFCSIWPAMVRPALTLRIWIGSRKKQRRTA